MSPNDKDKILHETHKHTFTGKPIGLPLVGDQMSKEALKSIPHWNGRRIIQSEDKHDLEQRAATYEFKHRMTREDAEHRAHHEYKKDKHREAAAFHLAGLKAAQGAGSHDEAHKHGLMYQLHLKALGHDPVGAVPTDVQALAEKQDKFYKFKPHRGDAFLLQSEGDGQHSVAKSEMLSKSKSKMKKDFGGPNIPSGITASSASPVPMQKGNVVPFPKDRVSPAQDLGQPATIAGAIGSQSATKYTPPLPAPGVFPPGTKGTQIAGPAEKARAASIASLHAGIEAAYQSIKARREGRAAAEEREMQAHLSAKAKKKSLASKRVAKPKKPPTEPEKKSEDPPEMSKAAGPAPM